jgi:hypothetical protein
MFDFTRPDRDMAFHADVMKHFVLIDVKANNHIFLFYFVI